MARCAWTAPRSTMAWPSPPRPQRPSNVIGKQAQSNQPGKEARGRCPRRFVQSRARLKRVAGVSRRLPCSASDRRYQENFVPILEGVARTAQEANILFVHINVEEAA